MKSVIALYREVLSVLPDEARRFLHLYMWLLASLALFDAAALGLLAVVIGPLSVGEPVRLPVFGELDFGGVIIAMLVICALMITKGVLSAAITWWGSRRTARYEVAIGDRLFRAYLHAPWVERLSRNSSDVMRFTDSGVDATINSFLRPGATLLGEAVSLIAIVATLAFVQPAIAAVTLVYLMLLGALLYLWIARHARLAGIVNLDATVRTSRVILEVMSTLKEVALRSLEDDAAALVTSSRTRSARARANTYFLGQIPRYVLESGIVGGFVVVGGFGFLLGGQQQAITAIALFGLAGFRMAPSIIRFQSVISQMLAASSFPRKVIDELRATEESSARAATLAEAALPANPRALTLADVSFRYPTADADAIRGVDLTIEFGSFVAFVGASGSGKSTMVDLLLGLLEPDSGSIRIDGIPLSSLRSQWRRQVAYVPQDVALFDATIAQNVALTWGDDIDRERVRTALERAQIWDLIARRPSGIDASVGERGLALSGGQRQRLGIARALYTDPLVLVMDEATSALDTKTESAVSDSIAAMGQDRTVVMVAHRLATVMHADRIFFMRAGTLVAAGTFDELVATVPDFAAQAALAGLA